MNDIYQQIVQFVQEQIASNELFKGGLILGIGAALLAYARAWPRTIWGWIVYHTTVELDIPEGSEAFKWVDRWLSQHNYSLKRARRLTARSVRRGGESTPHVTPAPGTHYLFEGGRFMIVRRTRQTLESANHSNGKAYTESIYMRMVGRSREPALKLLQKAFALADKPQDKVRVNYCDDYGGWFELKEKTPRSIESVVLPGDLTQEIVEDARQFLMRQEYYGKLGVPWRRGYLFFGEPGNGKSSMVFALASELKMEISILNLKEVTDTSLVKGISDIPTNSILLIEEIDDLFKEEDSRETKVTVSFSALINALDGVASPDGQMVVMTTNKREKLDPTLIRPGRVDKEVEFENATSAQACELFNLFYVREDPVEFSEAYEALPQPLSMAALQGIFLVNDTPEEATISIGNPQ